MPATMLPSRSGASLSLHSLQRLVLGLLIMASLSASWPERIRSLLVCSNLHVTHSGSSGSEMGRGNVSMVLIKDGGEVDCFEPNQDYTVKLKSNYKQMKGVLWMLDLPVVDGVVKGEFPLGAAPRNTKFNICPKPSVSHYCENQRDPSGCVLGSNGMSLTVGYRSPSEEDGSVIQFRYTVVFKVNEYMQDVHKSFQRCPVQTTLPANDNSETTTEPAQPPCPTGDNSDSPQPDDNNLTVLNVENNLTFDADSVQQCNTFEPKSEASPVTGNCGIQREKSNESRPYTKDNIDYNCVIRHSDRYARKVACESRCEKNGDPVICRVKNTSKRSREFICMPTSDFEGFGNIFESFSIEQQAQCVCYKLSEIDMNCPTKAPPPVRCQKTTTPPPTTPPNSVNRP